MIRPQLTVDETIDILNELIELDRPAIAALIANRVPCNEALSNHPSVQADTQHGGYHVGLLGIINGLFGTVESGPRAGWGPIMMVWQDGYLVRFARTERP